MAWYTGEACGFTATLSSPLRWPNHSDVMIPTIDAELAWWPADLHVAGRAVVVGVVDHPHGQPQDPLLHGLERGEVGRRAGRHGVHHARRLGRMWRRGTAVPNLRRHGREGCSSDRQRRGLRPRRGHRAPSARCRRDRHRHRLQHRQGRGPRQGARGEVRQVRRDGRGAGGRGGGGVGRGRAAAHRHQLRRDGHGGADHRQGRHAPHPQRVGPGPQHQPARHDAVHDPRGLGHVPQRAPRGRRPGRHRQHGLGGRVRRADRPAGLLGLEGRRRRHDPAGRPRPVASSASGCAPSPPA